MKLKGRNIVITGGGRGIGKEVARYCAANGANLAILARTFSEINNVAKEVKKDFKVEVIPIRCDVSKIDQVTEMYQEVESQLGDIYGLVCCAGIYGPIGPIDENPLKDWIQAIEINLLGTVNCIHSILKKMKKRKEGRLVLFIGGGQGPLPNFSSYVASKGALWRLTETLGKELAPFNIYLNAIAPGAINTRFLETLLQAGEENVGKEIYQKSLIQKEEGGISPEKAAECVVYLLSEESKGLYGKSISAVWDNYQAFDDFEKINQSDIYTFKRVIDFEGRARFK